MGAWKGMVFKLSTELFNLGKFCRKHPPTNGWQYPIDNVPFLNHGRTAVRLPQMSGSAGRNWSGKGGRQEGSGLGCGSCTSDNSRPPPQGLAKERDLPALLWAGRRAEKRSSLE